MTVLAKYQRLEAEGVWRAHPEAQRQDVYVSIGDATITIGAANGTALAHWSLPAIQRLNPGERRALYRPGEESSETLEIADAEMIDAVEKVLRSIQRGPGRTGRMQGMVTLGIGLAIFAAAAIWLPGAIIRYTASLVPDVARVTIGNQLLAEMDRVSGTPCAAPFGQRALEQLSSRLLDTNPTQMVVLPSALKDTAHLPGGTILVSHTLVEDFETPDVVAGYVLAEDLRRETEDPLARLLEFAGLRAALVLLSQGELPELALKRMAEAVIAEPPSAISDKDLIAKLNAAEVPAEPYARARDFSGETTTMLLQANATFQTQILEDGDWIALQRICEE